MTIGQIANTIIVVHVIIVFVQGWLVDLVNKFGVLGGFSTLQERICGGENLSVPLLAALLRYNLFYCTYTCRYNVLFMATWSLLSKTVLRSTTT